MKRFKVISLDMFQTLVNVQSRTSHVWRPILQQGYSEELAAELGALLLGHYYLVYDRVRESGEFNTTREIYKESFNKVFLLHSLDYDTQDAVDILFAEHRLAELYAETEHFLELITQEYPVCIVSDTDALMLPDFYKKYPIQLFTSEVYKSYKNDNHNTMFNDVIVHYGVEPGQIIHIGDSVADVLGAKKAGITACWINRNQETCSSEVAPDYIVTTLDEFYELL